MALLRWLWIRWDALNIRNFPVDQRLDPGRGKDLSPVGYGIPFKEGEQFVLQVHRNLLATSGRDYGPTNHLL